MAAIDLSTIPLRRARGRFLDFGAELTPGLGGPKLRINRLGNRYGLTIEGPPIPEEPDGRIATNLIRRAKMEGALYPWPQPGLKIGAPGSPAVDGAVAGGTSVPFRSVTPHYAIRQGQFFSFIHGGIRYLHEAAAQAIAGADGKVTVTIFPELRISLSDGDAIDLAKPMLEGLLASGDYEWDIMTEPFTGLETILIDEAE